MAVKLKPLHDKVVIEKPEEEKSTKSGIILPDNAKEKPQTGKIIAVGAGKQLDNGTVIPLTLKVGDTVYYSKYSGTEVKIEEKEYIIISESDILAIVA
ncbi:molecular chaperone GroES [Candidatus Termititenax spirochaetophilus]|uniref:Co-chaperonin GroES n=1 Tax=Candidatus Termititenax spirochaetophilus TaxID=2218522 RepID=A0A388T8E0_9BACT|nr:molecular chaperone GroES [Candidatus Termititenax spirochaetophilus]